MIVAHTLPELRTACDALRARHGAVALVPTMGALHAGHLALVDAALGSGGAVAASVFVNPLQFSDPGDLARYPREEAADLAVLEAAGCALAWLPDAATVYPPDDATTVIVAGPAERWEGEFRPGHFRGVATVCAKLFGQVRPQRAYFGEKDWQQLQVVRRMAADLLVGVEIVGVPTVREADGLALSSRNRFLGAEERQAAGALPATLFRAADALAAGASADATLTEARRALAEAGLATDYVALVDGPTLEPLAVPASGARLLAAVRIGSVRLIDNLAVS